MPKEDLVDRRRREIVEAAFRVFAERGYHNAGVADIARYLGIGHGTFYRYFDSKRDILLYVIDDAMSRIVATMTSESLKPADTLAEYRVQGEGIAYGLFDLFVANPPMVRLFFVESMSVDDELTDRMLDAYEALSEITVHRLRVGVDKGFLRPDLDPEVVGRAINGMIFAAAVAVLRARDPAAHRDLWVREVTALMFDGVAARRQAPTGRVPSS